MRVLYLAEGLDRCEFGMLERLVATGHAMEALVGNRDDAEKAAGMGIKAAYMPFRGRYDARAIRTIRQRIQAGQLDVIHCLRNNRPLTNTLVARIGQRVRLVAYRGTMGHLSRLDPASWASYLNPAIDRIVCCSDAVRQYLLGLGIPADKAVRIYKGHRPAWYETTPFEHLAEFGVPEGAHVVCCAANMRRDKGIDVLIRAFRHIPAERNIHLLLVGKVEHAEVNRAAADPAVADRIHFAGYRADAPRIIAAANTFVMPSTRREGLARAVLEAMCLRVPPVVTRVGGLPEVVIDGESGLVVPPSDEQALATAILTLAGSPQLAHRMGAAARARIEAAFSTDRMAEDTLKVYRGLGIT